MLLQVVFTVMLAKASIAVIYDSYTGMKASDEMVANYTSKNILEYCTNDIVLPCNETEGRRIDGSCNNINHPASGAFHTPPRRLLGASYSSGDLPRLSGSGEDLPLTRVLRKLVLPEGKSVHPEMTQLLSHAINFILADLESDHDTFNFLNETLYCCEEEGKSDHMCTPIKIAADDSTHRFDGLRCMNLTRPKSFQSYGCAPANTTLTKIDFTTPSLDLSMIYSSMVPIPKYRTYEGGLLMVEEEDDSVWPSSEGLYSGQCLANVAANNETRCFGTISPSSLGVNLLMTLFYRLHNIVAKDLGAMNPHWNDTKIFNTTQDICIAFSNQLIFYHILPALMGRDYMINSGLISEDQGFRDTYNETLLPQVLLEFLVGFRSMDVFQEGEIKMYDENNSYLKSEPIVNHTLRVGFLSMDDNFAKITRSAYLQQGGNNNRIVNPDIVEVGLGGLQRAADLLTANLRKDRTLGLAPLADYIEYFGDKKPETWEDLEKHLDPEVVEIIKPVYKNVSNVDFTVGLWGSIPLKGAFMPKLLSNITNNQMQHVMRSDRHWYELPNRPKAFTADQLAEVRKFNFTNFLCAAEDKIKTIPPNPLMRVNSMNPLQSCDSYEKWDLSAWADEDLS